MKLKRVHQVMKRQILVILMMDYRCCQGILSGWAKRRVKRKANRKRARSKPSRFGNTDLCQLLNLGDPKLDQTQIQNEVTGHQRTSISKLSSRIRTLRHKWTQAEPNMTQLRPRLIFAVSMHQRKAMTLIVCILLSFLQVIILSLCLLYTSDAADE